MNLFAIYLLSKELLIDCMQLLVLLLLLLLLELLLLLLLDRLQQSLMRLNDGSYRPLLTLSRRSSNLFRFPLLKQTL